MNRPEVGAIRVGWFGGWSWWVCRLREQLEAAGTRGETEGGGKSPKGYLPISLRPTSALHKRGRPFEVRGVLGARCPMVERQAGLAA